MTGSDLSSAGLDARRRRILFRAWRRGMREMDLLMGSFADAELPGMNDADLREFEELLDAPDPQVLAWLTGEEPAPAEIETKLFGRLRLAHANALAKEKDEA
jgi:antitoxin CptB